MKLLYVLQFNSTPYANLILEYKKFVAIKSLWVLIFAWKGGGDVGLGNLCNRKLPNSWTKIAKYLTEKGYNGWIRQRYFKIMDFSKASLFIYLHWTWLMNLLTRWAWWIRKDFFTKPEHVRTINQRMSSKIDEIEIFNLTKASRGNKFSNELEFSVVIPS